MCFGRKFDLFVGLLPAKTLVLYSWFIPHEHGWPPNFCMDDTFDKYCMKCSAPLFDGKLNYLVQFDYAAFDISINSCNNYLRNGTVWNFEFLDIELWVTFSNASLANKANELIHPTVVCYHHKYHHRGHINILKIEMYGKSSNIRGIKSPKRKCFSSRFAVVFGQSIEARCWV